MDTDTTELLALVDHLEDNIDDLEDGLEPLLASALSAAAKELPILDKAKLYVLIVYSIESLLFSYMRLHGIQAKEHHVFKELSRVKQYFAKIKDAEAGSIQRENLSLNKQAAGRIIKHALAGSDKFDLDKAERLAREKALANRKLKDLESSLKKKSQQAVDQSEDLDVIKGEVDEEGTSSIATGSNAQVAPPHSPTEVGGTLPQPKKKRKKRRTKAQIAEENERGDGGDQDTEEYDSRKKARHAAS